MYETHVWVPDVNSIQDELFRGCSQMGGKKAPLPKICHRYPKMMKLGTVAPYLKKIQKIYESRDTPLQFFWHQLFLTGNQQILLYQEIQMSIAFWYIISDSFNFFWVLNFFFNKQLQFNDVIKNGYSSPSKINIFWNKVMTSYLPMTSPTEFYYAAQIILYMCSCDQSLANPAFLWEKLSKPQFYYVIISVDLILSSFSLSGWDNSISVTTKFATSQTQSWWSSSFNLLRRMTRS